MRFHSTTPLDKSSVKVHNMEHEIMRRILAYCLDLDWQTVLEIEFDQRLMATACLEGVLRYHRYIHNIPTTQCVFVYIGIDDIHTLFTTTNSSSSGSSNREIQGKYIRQVTEVLRQLRYKSNILVSSLITGTHEIDMHNSMIQSGIPIVHLELLPLCNSTIYKILSEDVGLCQEYMEHPEIMSLIQGTTPVLTALGIAISHLPYKYDPNAIVIAINKAKQYLESFHVFLDAAERESLLTMITTGKLISNGLEKLQPYSTYNLDQLQNIGLIQLINCNEMSGIQISATRYHLENWISTTPSRVYAQSYGLRFTF